jgi:alkylation response protein AidB-like acyl-CoA dehydrogenase
MFMVPKFIPNSDSSLGARNGVRAISLEHKLGLHGAPTAVMDYDRAIGWLVGDENKGMAAMFTMMNNARLGVAGQGIAIAEAATQAATDYAMARKQGRTPFGKTAIIDHADVRRMLGQMRAETFAARAIALTCAVAIDMARATGDAAWAAVFGLSWRRAGAGRGARQSALYHPPRPCRSGAVGGSGGNGGR